mgnify:CR=1 FL=1
MHGEAMYSKKERIVKNDSDMELDDFKRIEEVSTVENMEVSEELSVVEQVFTQLQIFSEGFKASFFTNQDVANLRLTSKTLDSVIYSELNQRAAQKLLTHVVKGEQDKAQAMIEKKPELLLIRTQAVDYSGRTIIGTAFQAALGAGDKPMWEMMLPYFKSLEEGEAIRQFDEQFPNGIEDTPASELKAYYNAIALAIINDKGNGLSVIEGFRKEITCHKEITQGKHFNLQHLIAAYQAYIDNFNALGNWANRDLFWRKVIGYVQRQMTAYDAQIHCSGVQGVLDNGSSFSRTFDLSNGNEFFPLLLESGLGFDFACYSYHDALEWMPIALRPVEYKDTGGIIEKLCGAKTNALVGLRESLEQGMNYQPN